MSFSRHMQIYRSDVLFRPRNEAVSRFAPGFIVPMSLRPAIPRRVGLHQSPPPLHRLEFSLNPPAETVNHHPPRGGDFSTGEMRIFQPALTDARSQGGDAFAAIETIVPWRKFESTVAEAQTLAQPEDFDYLALLDERYGSVRRFAPLLLANF